MTSAVQKTVQFLTLLVEYAWSLPHFESTDRTNLETFSAFVAVVDEMHKCVDYSFHRCQEAFGLQIIIEWTSTDVRPRYMRTDGVEGDALFRQVFAV